MILDGNGGLIWFRPLDTHGVADFRAQSYRGRPVLTWWQGRAEQGVGNGYDVILDETYREIATRVRAGNGLVADIHEFAITPRNTALITVYHEVGKVLEGVVQEIDIASGKVVFEWHSLPEIATGESYFPKPDGSGAWDYFHINSVADGPGNSLLVSARNTHALYKISRATGKVVWRLGGRKSDFTMGPGARFAWQHDAHWRAPNVISLFDNEAAPPYAKRSRALFLRVDSAAGKVTLLRAYPSPDDLLSGSQGIVQLLPNGNLFVGWGANPWFTEFSPDGNVLLDGHFSAGADSYRAYKLPWVGVPLERPALAVKTDRRGRVTAYVSWNGATDVVRWAIFAHSDSGDRLVAAAPRRGFETRIDLGHLLSRQVFALAYNADGDFFGMSPIETRPAR
jgi:hypothetical protein